MSEGQYVADLAGLFERRKIALGDEHVCEQFEILLTTSDSFRGQLFTLCTAISHMSESDLSGDELLDLIARALRSDAPDGASLPKALRTSFLSGLDAWNNRGASGEDEWPMIKKPAARMTEAPSLVADPIDPPAAQSAELAAPSAPPARPLGVPTLQAALELARIRAGDHPLHAEPAALSPDPNSASIHELNALLADIEDRMKRLRPQVAPSEAPAPPTNLPAPLLEFARPAAQPAAPSCEPPPPAKTGRDSAFLERHPYLRRERPESLRERSESVAPEFLIHTSGPAEPGKPEANVEAKPETQLETKLEEIAARPAALDPVQPELRLVPRRAVEEIEPELHLVQRAVLEPIDPGPPTLIIPDTMRFKTYLALAVLAGIVLVGTPISGVIAYRYLHPVYMYDQAPPAPQPAAAAPDPAHAKAAKAGTQGRSRAHKLQPPAHHKPQVAVWPPPPPPQ